MGALNDACIPGCMDGLEPALAVANGCSGPPCEPEDSHPALCSDKQHEEPEGDPALVAASVKVLLQCLGEDVNRVGLLKTPLRVARAFAFATKGYQQVAGDLVRDALFPEAGVEAELGFAGGFGGMVVVRNIDLFSLCEACLLPFKVCCHVAYISSGLQVVGLSKLSRVADMFARRLQSPHRLAEEICEGLADAIKPSGVAVVLQSWHLPVPGESICGAKSLFKHSSFAFAGKGRFDDQSSNVWIEFVSILQLDGILIDSADVNIHNGPAKKSWCPCPSLDKDVSDVDLPSLEPTSNGYGFGRAKDNKNGSIFHSFPLSLMITKARVSSMVAAVEVILRALGQDTSKEELHLTSERFTRWLSNFNRGHQDRGFVAKDSCTYGAVVGMNEHRCRPSLKADLADSMTRETIHSSSLLYELDAPFCSLCEHHLLPFYGKAHVGYFATKAKEMIDRSAVLNIVEVSSQRLQVQERLTKDIAEAMMCRFNIQSIIVVLEATHICMVSRGIEKLGSSTASVAVFGHFATDVSAKAAFLKMITGRCMKRACD